MSRKSFALMAAGTVIFFFCSVSSADVPQMINYQGKLTTPEGALVNDTVQMTFSVYPDTLGSPADWTETQTEVVVKDGMFNVLLGSVNLLYASLFDGSVKFLGVQVESDSEMRPLKAMVTTGYAFRSQEADTAEYAKAAPAMPDDDWVIYGNDIYRELGNVGVGTTSPGQKLDVVGNIHASGTITSGTSLTIDGTNDKITATSGTIDFGDENLTTTGITEIGGFKMPPATAGYVLTSDDNGVGTWQSATGGDITAVNAGTGLTGGGESGDVTLDVDFAGSGSANTASRGDHDHDATYVNEGQVNSVISAMITDGEITNADISATASIEPSKISGIAWTSTNDGSGSGLDADLLDGQEASSFLIAASDYGRSGVASDLYEGTSTLADKYVNKADLDHLDAADGSPANAVYVDGAGNAGIGTTSPAQKLDVAGTTRMTGFQMPTDAGTGKVLTSDASGAGTWQAVAGGADNDWTFRITDTADTTLMMGGQWGIARYGNVLYGTRDSTHVNLGVACTTGYSGSSSKYCTVGGGVENTASTDYATVGGGSRNTAYRPWSTVGGGQDNTAYDSRSTVAGGYKNTASGSSSTVGGGSLNTSSGSRTTVGGGWQNTATSNYSTVSGGRSNTASSGGCTIAGGESNIASQTFTTIGGGLQNTASGSEATIGGGESNNAGGHYSTVGGGYQNTGGGASSIVGGGYNNSASGDASTVGGGRGNTSSNYRSTVGGGVGNDATAGYSTVGGGSGNTASGISSTVGGGIGNVASGIASTVSGGGGNMASGYASTVSGGQADTVRGDYSLAAGKGVNVDSLADYTFAFGYNFTTSTDHAVIFYDSDTEVKVGIQTTSPQGALDVNSTTGALIVPRMTTVQRDALTAVNGMIIYNTTTDQFNFYENGAWVTK